MSAIACTFAATGARATKQEWYHCHTCGLVGADGLCSSCAVTCHATHDIELHSSEKSFFCSCGSNRHCDTLRRAQEAALAAHAAAGKCTFELTGSKFAVQPWWECETCGLTGSEGMCEGCRRTCHAGHATAVKSVDAPFYCDCSAKGLHSRINPEAVKTYMEETGKCSFTLSGPLYVWQAWYYCKTCGMTDTKGCCAACVDSCHRGHDVELHKTNAKFWCDCGGEHQCAELQERQRLKEHMATGRCSFELTGAHFAKQAWYNCATCGLADRKGCCAACADSCHRGHDVSLRHTVASFYCDCGRTGCGGRRPRAGRRGSAASSGAPASASGSDASDGEAAAGTGAGAGTGEASATETPFPEPRDRLCVICLDSPCNAVIVHGETGHQCACLECAKMLHEQRRTCPMCRAKIDLVVQNFGV